MNQNSNHKFSDGERNLFKSIADHVQANPNYYKEAGEWLDEYCSESTYWLRQDNKLEELKKKHTQFPVLAHQETIENLKNRIKERRTPALLKRFQEARNYLLDKYGDENFVSKEIAANVIIITWLLTDPDAEKRKVGITELETWPWEPIDDVSKMTRSYAGFLFAQNKDAWMRLVCIGWDGITTSGTKAAPKDKGESTETEREGFVPHKIELMEQIAKKLRNWADQNKKLIRNFSASLTGPLPPMEYERVVAYLRINNADMAGLVQEHYEELISCAKKIDTLTADSSRSAMGTAASLVGKLRFLANRLAQTLKVTAQNLILEKLAETGQSNKGQLKMIHPTPQDIAEIIDKLKELQTTIANIEEILLEFPESQENNSKSLSIDQLINAVGQKSAGESIDTLKQALQKSLIDGFSSYPQNSNQATTQVLAKLPSLSQSRLKKLLKDDIPQLLADDRILEVKKQVWHGESPFTEEAQNLHFIQEAIGKQIKKNLEAERATRWQKHIRPIIVEIEQLLFPFWDYLKEHGSYGRSENVVLMDIIRRGYLPSLPEVINEFERIKYKLEVESQPSAPKKRAETEREPKNGEKAEGSMLKMPVRSSKDNWEAIKSEYDISKRDFGKKINFVSDSFKREIIFRDVEHAFVLASQGYSKPALILAGGVIEELLRLYLKHNRISPISNNFDSYIKACEQHKLLKSGISRLSDSVRHFRNLVHLSEEKTKKHTISKATAKGAVASIFTIANDF